MAPGAIFPPRLNFRGSLLALVLRVVPLLSPTPPPCAGGSPPQTSSSAACPPAPPPPTSSALVPVGVGVGVVGVGVVHFTLALPRPSPRRGRPFPPLRGRARHGRAPRARPRARRGAAPPEGLLLEAPVGAAQQRRQRAAASSALASPPPPSKMARAARGGDAHAWSAAHETTRPRSRAVSTGSSTTARPRCAASTPCPPWSSDVAQRTTRRRYGTPLASSRKVCHSSAPPLAAPSAARL